MLDEKFVLGVPTVRNIQIKSNVTNLNYVMYSGNYIIINIRIILYLSYGGIVLVTRFFHSRQYNDTK
jgi:hypothetical protein